MTNTNNTKNNDTIQKNEARIETRDGISNNSIRLLAYEYPWDLRQKWVELKFVPQGNGTAKLKYYSNGQILNPNDIPSSLVLYYKTYFKFMNSYIGFGRGTNMRVVAQNLENLTFTYNVDTFQIIVSRLLLPPSPLQGPKLEDEGIIGATIEGHIYSNLAYTDFNDNMRFSAKRELYRFCVRQDGLYAEYTKQVKISDGTYIIETAAHSKKVLDVLEAFNAGISPYNINRNYQGFKLEYDNVHKAYKIRNYIDTVLNWQKSQGKNVDYISDRNYGEQFWYLQKLDNGAYNLINARDISQTLNLDSNGINISVSKKGTSIKQQFRFAKKEHKELLSSKCKIASKINNNKVLDVNDNASADNVTIWDKGSGDNQIWIFDYDKKKGSYKIVNNYNGKALIWNSSLGMNVFVQAIHLTGSYGDWILEDLGDDYYIFKSAQNQNMVLDLYNLGTINGTNIQVHERNNGENQKFKLIPVTDRLPGSGNEYKIASKLDANKVVNVKNHTYDHNVVLNNKKNNVDSYLQNWIFEYDSDKYAYKITSRNNNKVLARINTTQTNVIISTHTPEALHHYWVLENIGDNYYIIRNYADQTMVLDVYNSATYCGVNIQVQKRQDTDNQKFKLVLD